MRIQDLLNALKFLQKTYVGKGDEEALIQTIDALNREITRRQKDKVKS
jgi:hypothetical protein